jgi:hypothetical protein
MLEICCGENNMGVGTPKHGTIDHRKLKVGRASLPDGEKPRPNYLGKTVDLAAMPPARGNNENPRTHVEPTRS